MFSIQSELNKYPTRDIHEKENAIKEILQELILTALSETDFFSHAAFYGGTALRIFYHMGRFSEDLDFSLIEKEPDFNLSQYFSAIESMVKNYGFAFEAQKKEKKNPSAVQTALLKGNEKEHLLLFFPNDVVAVPGNRAIKVKFEVDTAPDPGARFVYDDLAFPQLAEIRRYDGPSMFAGKIAAILNREWKERVKGRDLFDYTFYLQRGIKVNFDYLWAQIKGPQNLSDSNKSMTTIINLLNQKFEAINYQQAALDVQRFLMEEGKHQSSLHQWSPDYFKRITAKRLQKYYYDDAPTFFMPKIQTNPGLKEKDNDYER